MKKIRENVKKKNIEVYRQTVNIFNDVLSLKVQCPKQSGEFSYPGDCTKFYRCDNGQPTIFDCQAQLLFNPERGFCDWPQSVNTENCTRQDIIVTDASGESIGDLCNPHGEEIKNSFLVGHPSLCNAFLTCGGIAWSTPCTFCPEAMYFSQVNILAFYRMKNILCNMSLPLGVRKRFFLLATYIQF
ncbi:unnamed protein product [Candidula unifasciata]|uniref:Chitin-binding type-2 domain-containing protein n=1 Tax=Candidula unifasciata TaxID=100452 RepID=A0A8S3YZ06_9EUPU|nr:unnamed protein product [Candidula unifasciata]